MSEQLSKGIVLRYVGNEEGHHGAVVQGVPACDMTQAMIDESGYTVDELLAFSPAAYALAHDEPARDLTQQDGE